MRFSPRAVPFRSGAGAVLSWLFLWCGSSLAQETSPPQGAERAPQPAADGQVLFLCHAPSATSVYLAADFNNWAENQEGTITDERFKLEGPDEQGVFRRAFAVPPGPHKLKFAIDGDVARWFAPDWATETDAEGNAIIYVTSGGHPLLRSDVNADWKPKISEGTVTFHLYRPHAKAVYLAGDFNQWGDNESGKVTNAAHAMQGPGDDGVWKMEVPLSSGRHAYKFVVDGTSWESDPNAPDRDDEGHSIVTVP